MAKELKKKDVKAIAKKANQKS